MGFSVNTNSAAMAAMRTLAMTNQSLDQVQQRINSGLKINGARDNASTFAIAAGMRSDVAAFKAIQDSLSMGESVASVAVTAGEQILTKLSDLQTETLKALDPTANRAMIQENIDNLVTQVNDIVASAQFNGVNMLDGNDPDMAVLSSLNRTDPANFTTSTINLRAEDLTTTTMGIAGLNIETGYATLEFGAGFAAAVADAETIEFTVAGNTYRFEFVDDVSATGTTAAENIAVEYDAGDPQGTILSALMDKMRDSGFTVNYNAMGQLQLSHADGEVSAVTVSAGIGAEITDAVVAEGDPNIALAAVDGAMTTVKQALARLGTTANALESQKGFVKTLADELTSGIGALVDADLAEESARLQALQTKQQLGIQALSIANQGPSAVLALFR